MRDLEILLKQAFHGGIFPRPLKTFVLACLFSVFSPAQAGNWFDSETRTCEWTTPVADSYDFPFKKRKTVAGGEYLSLTKSFLNQGNAAPGNAVTTVSVLTAAQLSSMSHGLDGLRGSPMAAKVGLKLVGVGVSFTPLSGFRAAALGGLLDWLSSIPDATLVNIDRLQDFVAVGGIGGYVFIFKNPAVGTKPLIYYSPIYEIQLGNEPNKRKWLLGACVLPVEVILQEIETTAPGPNANNKKLIKQSDGSWRMWDITDQKYNDKILYYTQQDEQFAYFDTNEQDVAYRVHLYGGPVQRRSGPGSSWSTLYQTVEVR